MMDEEDDSSTAANMILPMAIIATVDDDDEYLVRRTKEGDVGLGFWRDLLKKMDGLAPSVKRRMSIYITPRHTFGSSHCHVGLCTSSSSSSRSNNSTTIAPFIITVGPGRDRQSHDVGDE
jgi:hypothetical protein